MTDIPDIQKKTTPDNTGNQKPELYGVGGWLLFFWISLVFFDPLYTVVTQYQFFDMQELTYPGLENYPEWGNMKWFFWGMTIFCIMLSCRLFFELSLQMVIGASCHIDTLGDRTSANSACHILSRHEF